MILFSLVLLLLVSWVVFDLIFLMSLPLLIEDFDSTSKVDCTA